MALSSIPPAFPTLTSEEAGQPSSHSARSLLRPSNINVGEGTRAPAKQPLPPTVDPSPSSFSTSSDSGSTDLGSSPSEDEWVTWGLNLAIMPQELETRHWAMQQEARLVGLDRAAELCTALLWLAAVLRMQQDQRHQGQIFLGLAVAQLSVLHLVPRLWVQYRPLLLNFTQLVRLCFLLPLPDSAGDAASGSSIWTTVMSRVWSHLYFVLFHQMPIRYHLPWLLVSTVTGLAQCIPKLDTAALQPELDSPLLTMCSVFEKALVAVAGSFGPMGLPGELLPQVSLLPHSAALASLLFTHLFGALLLPLYITYLMEWRSKLWFLMSMFQSPMARMTVYSPAAATLEGSPALAYSLYMLWMLLIGLSIWAACSAAATVLFAHGFGLASSQIT